MVQASTGGDLNYVLTTTLAAKGVLTAPGSTRLTLMRSGALHTKRVDGERGACGGRGECITSRAQAGEPTVML